MSRAMDIADIMASRLLARPGLTGVPVTVDRQKDIYSGYVKKIGKLDPACVVITYDGFSNPDRSQSGRPLVTRRYTVTIYGVPVMETDGGHYADEVLETVCRDLHDWAPEETSDDLISEVAVTGGDYRPDVKYLIYDIDVEILSTL